MLAAASTQRTSSSAPKVEPSPARDSAALVADSKIDARLASHCFSKELRSQHGLEKKEKDPYKYREERLFSVETPNSTALYLEVKYPLIKVRKVYLISYSCRGGSYFARIILMPFTELDEEQERKKNGLRALYASMPPDTAYFVAEKGTRLKRLKILVKEEKNSVVYLSSKGDQASLVKALLSDGNGKVSTPSRNTALVVREKREPSSGKLVKHRTLIIFGPANAVGADMPAKKKAARNNRADLSEKAEEPQLSGRKRDTAKTGQQTIAVSSMQGRKVILTAIEAEIPGKARRESTPGAEPIGVRQALWRQVRKDLGYRTNTKTGRRVLKENSALSTDAAQFKKCGNYRSTTKTIIAERVGLLRNTSNSSGREIKASEPKLQTLFQGELEEETLRTVAQEDVFRQNLAQDVVVVNLNPKGPRFIILSEADKRQRTQFLANSSKERCSEGDHLNQAVSVSIEKMPLPDLNQANVNREQKAAQSTLVPASQVEKKPGSEMAIEANKAKASLQSSNNLACEIRQEQLSTPELGALEVTSEENQRAERRNPVEADNQIVTQQEVNFDLSKISLPKIPNRTSVSINEQQKVKVLIDREALEISSDREGEPTLARQNSLKRIPGKDRDVSGRASVSMPGQAALSI